MIERRSRSAAPAPTTLENSPDSAALDPGKLLSISYPSGSGSVGNGTIGYERLGQPDSVEWARISDGTLITADEVTRSLTGRILTAVADHDWAMTWTYTYDTAQRLVRGEGYGHDFQYGYDPTGGCGPNPAAGANSNRTTVVDGTATVAEFCFDLADRLTSTTQPGYTGAISYDSHGNTTLIGGNTYTYDTAGRHVGTEVAGVRRVGYTRDAYDRIVSRTDTDLAAGTSTVTRYSYGDSQDAADLTFNDRGALLEANYTFPGGVIYTQRPAGGVWSYPNLHGDIAATTDHTGTKLGVTAVYDPFGSQCGEDLLQEGLLKLVRHLRGRCSDVVDWRRNCVEGKRLRTSVEPSALDCATDR